MCIVHKRNIILYAQHVRWRMCSVRKKRDLLAMKSRGRFSGRARELISPMEGLNIRSRPSMSGRAAPDRIVLGALASCFTAFSSAPCFSLRACQFDTQYTVLSLERVW